MKIAITGKMCSGKTTLAQQICRLDNRHQIYSFSTGVKEIAIKYFNMQEKDRSLLINIGSKFREINENVWINYLINSINDSNFCIIDDLRHQNELDKLIEHNFTIIRLHITKEEQIKRLKKIYNNYEDHIKNLNSFTESCNLNYPENTNIININYNEDYAKINQKLHSLLQKNK